MLTLDEELVERAETKVKIEHDLTNKVKDGIRAGPIA
jgi:hypothetical protein